MAQTILTGAALESSWRAPDLPNSSDNPGTATPSDAPDAAAAPDGSGVRALATAADAAVVDAAVDSAADRAAREAEDVRTAIGLADTQQHTPGPQIKAVLGRKHARTLRMEIGISTRPPGAQDDSAPPTAASESAQPAAASSAPATRTPARAPILAGATQRIGVARDSDANPRQPVRSTDPFGRAPASGRPGGTRGTQRRPSPAAPKPAGARPAAGAFGNEPAPAPAPAIEPPRTFEPPTANSPAPRTHFGEGAWQTAVDTHPPRKRSRAGDKTVVTRRKRTGMRDWLFVGVLVAALGVTASLLLSSYRSPRAEQSPATGATTVEHAVNPAAETNTANQAAAPSGDFTQIVSTPAGAELVSGGAVVGNTPARVARTSFDTDYLVRLAGHEPQLVRITAASPTSIAITLKPTGAAAQARP